MWDWWDKYYYSFYFIDVKKKLVRFKKYKRVLSFNLDLFDFGMFFYLIVIVFYWSGLDLNFLEYNC